MKTYPQLLSHLSRPQPTNHTNCTITAPLLQSVLSWIYVCHICKRLVGWAAQSV